MSCAYQEQPPKKPLLAYALVILILTLIVIWGSGCNTVKGTSSSEVKDKDSSGIDLQEWFNHLSSDSTVTQNDNGTYQRAYIWNGGPTIQDIPNIKDSGYILAQSVQGINLWQGTTTPVLTPGYSYFEKGTYNRDKKTEVHKTQDQHWNVYHHYNITTHYKVTETTKDNHRTAWWLPVLFISIVAGAGLYLFNKFSSPIMSLIKSFK